MTGREERVVGPAQAGVDPDDPLRRRHEQDAVVVAVRDQQISRHDFATDRRQAERIRRDMPPNVYDADVLSREHVMVRRAAARHSERHERHGSTHQEDLARLALSLG